MTSFSEQLRAYIDRSGITDAELARSVGVRRQTIFRWKEGLVKRPRYRDDIVRVADRLRLSPHERDALLLAAGFAPEGQVEVAAEAEAKAEAEAEAKAEVEAKGDDAEVDGGALTVGRDAIGGEAPGDKAAGEAASADDAVAGEAVSAGEYDGAAAVPGALDTGQTHGADEASDSSTNATGDGAVDLAQSDSKPVTMTLPAAWQASLGQINVDRKLPVSQRRAVGFLALVAVALIALFAVMALAPSGWRNRPVEPASTAAPATTAPGAALPQARDDEALLLVAEFANYAADQAFNVAGRIQEALITEVSQAALTDTRVVVWSEVVDDAAQAADVLASSGAAALVWGEYDSGRVRVNVALPGGGEGQGWVRLLSSPNDLASTVNAELPQEVRVLALMTLGRLYREEGAYGAARTAFKRALDLQPTDRATEATLHFLLATVLERGDDANLADAIAAYSRVIPLRPDWVNARYNRGSAYLQRYYAGGEPDLLDAAIADFTSVLDEEPSYSDAFLNRGIAYYERNRPGDLELAYRDMTAALARSPASYRVYFNRGLLNIRRDDPQWRTDLERALQRNPEHAASYSALCWGYVLDGEADTAIDHCDQALEMDPSSPISDTLGIAYAQLERTDEAIASLESYLVWLRTLPRTAYARYNGPLVEEWIDALRAGDMPFDRAMLDRLRG